jgi:hypothetical protein
MVGLTGRKIRCIAFFIALVAFALCTRPVPTGEIISANSTYFAQRGVDGDTIKLSTGDAVRLLNIDTPEKGQYLGKEASARMHQLVDNRTVLLEPDQTDRDKYGRLLRYVYAEGQMLNLIMVKEGFARAYYIAPDDRHLPEIEKLEQEAKSKNLGIWKYDSIYGAFCVWVYDFVLNSKVSSKDPNREYVVLRNSCNHSVELGGWKMQGQSGNFTFPKFSLGAKDKVWIRSGSGKDNATDLFWGSASHLWSKTSVLKAYNAQGQMVLDYSYGA